MLIENYHFLCTGILFERPRRSSYFVIRTLNFCTDVGFVVSDTQLTLYFRHLYCTAAEMVTQRSS
jgi:hypothetical protein